MATLVRFLVVRLLVVLIACPLLTPAQVHADEVHEVDMKAVFLYHFSAFVEWPPKAFIDPYAPFVIGVLGDDPFGEVLDQVIQGEFKNQHPIIVRRFSRRDDFTKCHILYVSDSERRRLNEIMNQLKGRPILTVSDIDGFNRAGGIVQFKRHSNRIGLAIDKASSDKAGLQISSKLLRLAERT